jgi:hypothetical protein
MTRGGCSAVALAALVFMAGCEEATPSNKTTTPAAKHASTSRAAAAKPECPTWPELDEALRRLVSDPKYHETVGAEELAKHPEYKTSSVAYTYWVFRAGTYRFNCRHDNSEMPPIRAGAQRVTERHVDGAMAKDDCAGFHVAFGLDLPPYEPRFGKEVMKRDFAAAEVTRRVWLNTLETAEQKCGARLSRRTIMAVQAQEDKLRRIVGLDDPTLIDLRSKLISAVEANDADAVVSWSRAIAEREKAIDARNASAHEARLRNIEERVRANAAKQASAKPPTGESVAGEAAKTAADVKKTVNDVRDTVQTSKEVLSLLGL